MGKLTGALLAKPDCYQTSNLDEVVKENFTKGLQYLTKGNIDLAKYHFITASNLKHAESSYEVGKQFMIEGDNNKALFYLLRAVEMGLTDAIHFLICWHLDDNNLSNAYAYIEKLNDKTHRTFLSSDIVDKILECTKKAVNKNRTDNDYSDIIMYLHQYITIIHYNMNSKRYIYYYNEQLIDIIIDLYTKIYQANSTNILINYDTYKLLCKILDHSLFFEYFFFSSNNKYIVCKYLRELLYKLIDRTILKVKNSDVNSIGFNQIIVRKIGNFCKDIVINDAIYLKCCFILGQIKEQEQINDELSQVDILLDPTLPTGDEARYIEQLEDMEHIPVVEIV